MNKLTWRRVQAFCQVLDRGVSVRWTGDGIKVAWGKGDNRQEYFTDDLLDAVETIKANFEGAESFKQAWQELGL